MVCCSSDSPGQLAERGDSVFHRQFEAEDYESIYNSADEAFRKQGSEAELKKNMKLVREKLGRLERTRQIESATTTTSSAGTTVKLTYESDFSNGTATERFVWKISNKSAVLVRYEVNSPVFDQG
jgi:hypothetical protein